MILYLALTFTFLLGIYTLLIRPNINYFFEVFSRDLAVKVFDDKEYYWVMFWFGFTGTLYISFYIQELTK